MPIPFLLAGLGVAAGIIGAGGHLSAKETNERAQRISEDAQELYNSAKRSLEVAQDNTEKALVKLGYAKKSVLDTSMNQFLTNYDKVKHIQVKNSIGINEISKFTIDQQGAIQLREMTNIYSASFASGATGVAAGTAIALAASGALPVVTGELALAGSALAAGEIGMAAGFAGSALSFGAAMTPLAAVAAPVILFTGISASMKADENLEKARAMYAEAEVACEKMKISETLCDAISEKSEMFDDLLGDLNKMFSECTGLLAGVIRKKEGKVFKKKLTSEDFTEEDLKLIAVTRALAGAVKSVIDTPILSKDGNISYEAEEMYDQTVKKLPDFSKAVEEVKAIDYNVNPVTARDVKNQSSGGGVRRVFAVILGLSVASAYAETIALSVTNGTDKFWFTNSYTANYIAMWLFLFTSVTMLIGEFHERIIGKICGWGSGIALSILYVQYIRTIENMNHYILFSVLFFVGAFIVFGILNSYDKIWHFAKFFESILIVLLFWPIGFIVYAFFSLFLGFSSSFWLVVTAVLLCIFSLAMMVCADD